MHLRPSGLVAGAAAALLVLAVLLGVPGVAGASGLGWTPPVAGPLTVVRPFQSPPNPYAAGHRGVDVAADAGTAVLAAADGRVAFAGSVAGREVVSVQTGVLRLTYEPVHPAVAAGQEVRRGALLGQLLAGHPGCPAPACLHWGVRRGRAYLDPLSLLRGPAAVRLLPIGGRDPPTATGETPRQEASPPPAAGAGRRAGDGAGWPLRAGAAAGMAGSAAGLAGWSGRRRLGLRRAVSWPADG